MWVITSISKKYIFTFRTFQSRRILRKYSELKVLGLLFLEESFLFGFRNVSSASQIIWNALTFMSMELKAGVLREVHVDADDVAVAGVLSLTSCLSGISWLYCWQLNDLVISTNYLPITDNWYQRGATLLFWINNTRTDSQVTGGGVKSIRRKRLSEPPIFTDTEIYLCSQG